MNRRRGHADGGSSLRVVLGESAQSRTLREILDGAGFDVIGQGSTPRDLLRLLAVTEPDVIVLDAEVSATAALSARDLAPLAGIVVVWPSAVSSSVADRQVTPTRAAFDLPDAVRRAKRPQEARAAALAPVAAFGKAAEVIPLPARPRGPWRAREHAFGLVAASFIIAVTALGLLSTAVNNPSLTRGEGVQSTGQLPPTTSGSDGENQEPQDPTNVEPQPELPPFGQDVLVVNVEPAPLVQGLSKETKPPKDHEGGDSTDGGDGDNGGPDDQGRDHPQNPPQHHRRVPPGNSCDHRPCNGQHIGGIGHVVHGADGHPVHGDHGHVVGGDHGKPGK
jgi:hypothetical protein